MPVLSSSAPPQLESSHLMPGSVGGVVVVSEASQLVCRAELTAPLERVEAVHPHGDS